MKTLTRNFDFLLLAVILTGFAYIAAQRLATVPLPDSDEAMMLQIPYEMLNHGKLAFPMKSFYGGNIENAWHSLTPLAFAALSGFFKLFGWGLAQGRAFNLITAILLLLLVHLIARKLFSWHVGLTAVLFMISDPLFLTRSRLLRYDILSAAFGLLAFYLYETAEERKSPWLYLASGLAAGAGVMCHTNLLYMLAVVALLIFLRNGWRVVKTAKPYLFASGALAAMAYEIVFAIVDFKNFLLQTRNDSVHFRVLDSAGWLRNLETESLRYTQWFDAHGARFASHVTLIHVFLWVTIAAIIYLIARGTVYRKDGSVAENPRLRLLVATIVVVFFFALVTQRKITQYVVHISPWFALCSAVFLKDCISGISSVRDIRWGRAKLAYGVAMFIVMTLVAGYGYELFKQNKTYLAQVRDPRQANFEEIKTALRSIVPEGTCPISIGCAYLWLAFPEKDHCYFAVMEARPQMQLDLKGKDYALIVKPKFEDRLRRLTGAGFEQYQLLGELNQTAYGTFRVYYTGSDPRYVTLPPKSYQFFRRERGLVSEPPDDENLGDVN